MFDNVKHLHAKGSTFTEVSGGVYTFVNGPLTPPQATPSQSNCVNGEDLTFGGPTVPNQQTPSHASAQQDAGSMVAPKNAPESLGKSFPPTYTEAIDPSWASKAQTDAERDPQAPPPKHSNLGSPAQELHNIPESEAQAAASPPTSGLPVAESQSKTSPASSNSRWIRAPSLQVRARRMKKKKLHKAH